MQLKLDASKRHPALCLSGNQQQRPTARSRPCEASMSTNERLLGGYTDLITTSLKIVRTSSGPSGEIGRHIGLKIRRFVNNGHTGSNPVSGTTTLKKQIFPIYLLIF